MMICRNNDVKYLAMIRSRSICSESSKKKDSLSLSQSRDRARREARQQVKNVYSYDLIINQIIRSFFNDALSAKAFNHLLFYFSSTISIQIRHQRSEMSSRNETSTNLETDFEKMTSKKNLREHESFFLFFFINN